MKSASKIEGGMMRRLLLCLPFCALLAPANSDTRVNDNSSGGQIRSFADDMLLLPNAEEIEHLAKVDPVGFLEYCLRRYQRNVKGYTTIMYKQERLGGKLYPLEVIEVSHRREPNSTLFRWKQGERQAKAVLYVEGEFQQKVHGHLKSMLQVYPSGLARFAGIVQRDPDGVEAHQGGRYTLPDSSFEKALLRTWTSWKTAQEKGQLHVEYLGKLPLKEAGNRLCYVLRRTRYQKPEEDGIREGTFYFDVDTWLQIGSELKDDDGKWVARYYFADTQLVSEFSSETFTRQALYH